MSSSRVLRLEVPSREVLDRLATGALPGGLDVGPPRTEFCRDVYFDTVAGDLEGRGVTVRVRYVSDGSCTLAVDVREREEDGQIVRTREEEPVSPDASESVLYGASAPARLLQSMIEPSRLAVQLEVETTRRVRHARFPDHPESPLLVVLDLATLRHEAVSAEFQEMELHFDARLAAAVERVVREAEEGFALRVTLATKLARAREILGRLEIRALEAQVRGAREVAVIAVREGKLALVPVEDGLRIPSAQGTGEEACWLAMRAALGRSQGRVRLLGTSRGLGTRPAIEVWLAQRIPEAEEGVARVVWLELEEALTLVGAPELRVAATLTALHMAARVDLSEGEGRAWSAAARSRKEHPFRLVPRMERPAPALPAEAEAEAGGKRKERPPPETLLNMELSELAFQERVLALASDERTPLLDRVRFLSILGSNLDQFFMTRVAGFHQQLARGSEKPTLDGLTPEEQLDVIGVRVRAILDEAYRFLWDRLLPDLRAEGIEVVLWDDATEAERADLVENYAVQLAAVLTPLAADPSHPFPHIRNLRPALAVVVRVPETSAEHFAAIELPGDLPRFVPLPGGRRFVPLEDVIRASLPRLYRGLEVVEAHVFRVTRSANFSIDEESVADLLEAVQEKVFQRPLGPVVRLEVQASMPREMRELLLRELQFEPTERVATLREEDLYAVDRLVDLFGLQEIAELPFDDLHYPPFPRSSPLDPARSTWEILADRSVLVQFPYDSFEDTVERLLREAAEDDDVTSIKITLYRTSRGSGVVKCLREARRRGKDVLALVELKASFDEQRNIEWARALESAGIHVVYGPAHLKVHAKVLLVLRREAGELRRYLYVGTGNMNAATAAGYTDLGLFSTDPELGAELTDVFNALTGYSVRTDYEHLLVAPFNMRERFLSLIRREVEHARAGRGGHMRVKINGLTDPEVILALYRASQAGVKIEMIVRGLCCLRPGVPGLSENVGVISILGRFLEHSRIFRFENAGEPEYFIGSADWRPRNLSRRVEVVAPVRDAGHRAELDRILSECLANPDAWELRGDGSYVQRTPTGVRESPGTFVAPEPA